MATQVRQQLDAKLSGGPRPTPLTPAASLYPDMKEIKKQKMIEEVKETVDTLRQAGVRSTVVVEAD